jgi:hypothetical protein
MWIVFFVAGHDRALQRQANTRLSHFPERPAATASQPGDPATPFRRAGRSQGGVQPNEPSGERTHFHSHGPNFPKDFGFLWLQVGPMVTQSRSTCNFGPGLFAPQAWGCHARKR